MRSFGKWVDGHKRDMRGKYRPGEKSTGRGRVPVDIDVFRFQVGHGALLDMGCVVLLKCLVESNERTFPIHRDVVDNTGASAVFFIAVLGVIALVIAELVRVVDENTDTESKLTSCRARTAKVVPFTSIKIVLVAWQIVTQVRGGREEWRSGASFSFVGLVMHSIGCLP